LVVMSVFAESAILQNYHVYPLIFSWKNTLGILEFATRGWVRVKRLQASTDVMYGDGRQCSSSRTLRLPLLETMDVNGEFIQNE